jgi:hypothetical protein
MSSPRWNPLARPFAIPVAFLGAAFLLSAASSHAQSEPSHPANSFSAANPVSATESSSSSSAFVADNATGSSSSSDTALPSAPAAGGAAAAGGQSSGASDRGLVHHLTFEAGAGVGAPAGGTQKDYITWGGQFIAGGGYRFNQRLSALIEYQFLDNKLPGAIIAETGANGGYSHIWSLSVAPVVDVFPKSTNDVYVTGGAGFYRKVTNFTDPEETEFCSYYYCEPGVVNQVVGHFSSNQGGWNIGGGFTHRMGGIYGDGKTKLFAEVRYLDVLTPAETTEPNGLGKTTVAADTKLIPITLGVRF